MKRCSTCNRTYSDPNLSFCTEDGTPLTEERPADESNVVAYRPPAPYTPSGVTPRRKRRVWPWIAGLFGVFLLGAIALTIAAVIILPRLAASATDNTNNTNQSVQTETATPETVTPETETETVNTPLPADEQQVLAQLRDLENDWTVANLNADKRALDRILADDYVGQSSTGGLQGKVEYIRDIKRDTTVERWQFDDLKVMLAGDRATLTGNITFILRDRQVVWDFKDTFVWRDGRWQATGSEVTPRE